MKPDFKCINSTARRIYPRPQCLSNAWLNARQHPPTKGCGNARYISYLSPIVHLVPALIRSKWLVSPYDKTVSNSPYQQLLHTWVVAANRNLDARPIIASSGTNEEESATAIAIFYSSENPSLLKWSKDGLKPCVLRASAIAPGAGFWGLQRVCNHFVKLEVRHIQLSDWNKPKLQQQPDRQARILSAPRTCYILKSQGFHLRALGQGCTELWSVFFFAVSCQFYSPIWCFIMLQLRAVPEMAAWDQFHNC